MRKMPIRLTWPRPWVKIPGTIELGTVWSYLLIRLAVALPPVLLICAVLLPGCVGDSATPVPETPVPQVIHVAADGFNSNPGTTAEPLASLDRAMELMHGSPGGTILVAVGEYRAVGNQRWNITGGINIIGGCDRATWEPVAGAYSEIELPPRSIKALDIRIPTRISGLHFKATFPGDPTSNPVYLFGCSSGLVFADCILTAAAGESGRDGHDSNDHDPSGEVSDGQPGQPGACSGNVPGDGGEGGISGSKGGQGGSGGLPGQPGAEGENGHYFGAEGGQGGMPGQDGQQGVDGQQGENGSCGSIPEGIGYFEGTSYLPFSSSDGSRGNMGQSGGGGGGGGGSSTGTGGGGGGGGSGGLSGFPGMAGEGGGHSIALICVNSRAVFTGCRFTAGNGGPGGRGGRGGRGSDGGNGGPGGEGCPGETGSGGRGGDGGNGGSGGGGAGGNGGYSIAVFLSGNTAVTISQDCIFQTGEPGTGGAGGLVGDGPQQAPSGLPGLAMDILDETRKEKGKP